MKLQTLLTIDVDELTGDYLGEKYEALLSIVRETGAVAVDLTGCCGKYAALWSYAREQLRKANVTLVCEP